MPHSTHPPVDVAIIGAGMAGLMAATALQARGYSAVVLDKGRGVGGRMSTRRIDDLSLDHGAQYVTASDPAFAKQLDQWRHDGLIRSWFDQLPVMDEQGTLTIAAMADKPRFIPTGKGMSAWPKALAQSLTTKTSWRVSRLELTCNGWTVWGEVLGSDQFEALQARALIITSPLPQTLDLFANSDIDLQPDQHQTLSAIDYSPCWSVMVVADKAQVTLPAPGGFKGYGTGEPIGWVADNTQKYNLPSNKAALTIQAGPQWSQDHLEATPEQVWGQLRPHCAPFLAPTAKVEQWQAHRWRYAFPVNPLADCATMRVAQVPLCWLAGDAFGTLAERGGKVETAALSGLAAAEALTHHLPAQRPAV
jgi:renalase